MIEGAAVLYALKLENITTGNRHPGPRPEASIARLRSVNGSLSMT